METSQPLATESFSKSWLINKRPSIDAPNCMIKSNRLFQESQNFSFDIRISKSSVPTNIVHADEIFSDGKILPMYLDESNIVSFDSSVSSSSSKELKVIEKLTKSSLKKFKKCLSRIFGPFGRRIGLSRKSTRVDDIDRKEKEEVVDQEDSPFYDSTNDIENIIYEAVLHCKRSIIEKYEGERDEL